MCAQEGGGSRRVRMTDPHDAFENPLAGRYASRAMVRIFSARYRFATWRRLWLALAKSQAELGLPIAKEQLTALEAHLDDIDFERAAVLETELRHDVMAHVKAWQEACPEAGGILHLGATSCFITDNSELIQIRAALELLAPKLRRVLRNLAEFAREHRNRATVGYTHFQPAQFTTVGKRAAMWLQDLLMDHGELERMLADLRFRGVKGTTGTQDSFLKLFDGDREKVWELDRLVCERMGFEQAFTITGQTYTRKQDARVMAVLSGIAQSAGKMSCDLRLLCHMCEVEEPFGKKQIGSSAMAYKRNPMRSERVAALSRWLITISLNPALTTSTQWMERTLDDSANRRMCTSEGFLCADAILELLLNLTGGLVVRGAVIENNARQQVPFIASEEILMEASKAGGDRQELHEVIRVAAVQASERLKSEGTSNDFLERLERHPQLAEAVRTVRDRLEPTRYTGLAADQVTAFLRDEVEPVLARYHDEALEDEVRV